MALNDIIKSIEHDAQAKMAEAEMQGKETLAAAQKEWQAKVQARQDQVRADWQTAVAKKISQSVLKLKADSQNKILLAKQKIIDQVFEQSLQQLGGLPEAEYVALLAKLIDQLPATEGSLVSVKGKTQQLKQALSQSTRKYQVESEEIEGVGGFVFQTKDFSVDNRFTKLLENRQEDLRVIIGQILFS